MIDQHTYYWFRYNGALYLATFWRLGQSPTSRTLTAWGSRSSPKDLICRFVPKLVCGHLCNHLHPPLLLVLKKSTNNHNYSRKSIYKWRWNICAQSVEFFPDFIGQICLCNSSVALSTKTKFLGLSAAERIIKSLERDAKPASEFKLILHLLLHWNTNG